MNAWDVVLAVALTIASLVTAWLLIAVYAATQYMHVLRGELELEDEEEEDN